MRQNLLYALLILAATPVLKGQEYRGSVAADFNILSRLEGEAEIELRKAWIPESFFNRTFQCQIDYALTKRWTVGMMYSYSKITEKAEYTIDEGDENLDRNRFGINLTYQAKRFDNDLRLSSRLRYQYSMVDDAKPRQYLRNKITLDYRITRIMNPYVAIEPYYRLETNKINIFRVYLGNEMPFFNTRLEIYYIAEIRLKIDYTTARYIVGMAFKLDYRN
jgi:hypothetical protein